MRRSPFDAFCALMSSQGGVGHVRQGSSLGLGRAAVTNRLSSGSWIEVQPGVVGAAGVPESRERAVWAAYLSVLYGGRSPKPRPVAVAGVSAAASYGWTVRSPYDAIGPRLITPYGVRGPSLVDDAEVRRVGDWNDRRFALVAGRTTTVPIDTVLDLAAGMSRDDLFAVVQEELFRRPSGRDRLLCRTREGVAGSTAVRGIVGALDRGIDSVLHEHGHRHLAVVRLPPPTCGIEVIEGMGSVDCAIMRPGAVRPPWGMLVGWDGELHRLKRRKFRHDRVRDRRAKKGGWESVHYGWEDHEEPADMYDDMLVTWGRVLAG